MVAKSLRDEIIDILPGGGCVLERAGVSFVKFLGRRIPALAPLFREHLADYYPDILPHLFMADVERWAETAVVSDDQSDRDAVRALLAELEAVFVEFDPEVSDSLDDVSNVIAVSFVEQLPTPAQAPSPLVELLGPKLRKEWEETYTWQPPPLGADGMLDVEDEWWWPHDRDRGS